MCDYSLHATRTRDAVIDDELRVTHFSGTATTGLSSKDDYTTAVCLRPGTELAIVGGLLHDQADNDYLYDVAVFCKINNHAAYLHHDALEFPDGRQVLIHNLQLDQQFKVLQLPASVKPPAQAIEEASAAEPAAFNTSQLESIG